MNGHSRRMKTSGTRSAIYKRSRKAWTTSSPPGPEQQNQNDEGKDERVAEWPHLTDP